MKLCPVYQCYTITIGLACGHPIFSSEISARQCEIRILGGGGEKKNRIGMVCCASACVFSLLLSDYLCHEPNIGVVVTTFSYKSIT